MRDTVRPTGKRRFLVLLHNPVRSLPVAVLEQRDRVLEFFPSQAAFCHFCIGLILLVRECVKNQAGSGVPFLAPLGRPTP